MTTTINMAYFIPVLAWLSKTQATYKVRKYVIAYSLMLLALAKMNRNVA